MDETTRLTTLLARAAEDLGEVRPPTVAEFEAQRWQGRRRALSVATAVAVTLVVAVTVGITRHAPTSMTRPVHANSADLLNGRWTALPPAPITPRASAASVWTGHQMLVWGGGEGSTEHPLMNTGAAYDPGTRTWTKLPAGPLSPRVAMASVWTGKYWFIWGGYASATATIASDGALYDPATRTWHLLPSAPVASSGSPTAVWNGSQVIVLTAARADGVYAIHAEAFSPRSNRWTTLPNIVGASDHPLIFYVALAVGHTVVVWYEWERVIALGKGSTSSRQGVDGYVLDRNSTNWTPDPNVASGIAAATGALWTGERVFIPIGRGCWTCSGPIFAGPLGGILVDPRTGRKTYLAKGSTALEQQASYVWTGRGLLAFGYEPGYSSKGGGIAFWDAKTNVWHTLAKAPQNVASYESSAVWTGSHLLVWGETNESHPVELGLEFGS